MTTSATTDVKKILVVEDSRVMADVLRFNLQRAGFDVTVAGDGLKGVKLLEENCYDLILTDYQMPYMNGDELGRRARAMPAHAETPIYLVSAKEFELDKEALTEELSLAGVLCKPFSPREIVALVQSVFVASGPQ